MKFFTFLIGFILGGLTFAWSLKNVGNPPTIINHYSKDTVYIDLEGQDLLGTVDIDGCQYFFIHSPNCLNPLHIEVADTIPENAKLYSKK